MSATWTSRGWCPPVVEGQPRYTWTISFKPNGEYWSTQSSLIGGPPADVDLEATLRSWFQERGGPAAEWRIRVIPLDDEATVLAQATVTFSEPVTREVRRLGSKPPIAAPTFYTSSKLLPPSPTQLAAWAKRDAAE